MTSTNEPAADLSELVGSWNLDPGQTSIVFQTKAMWVFPVNGAFKAIEGSGTVGDGGSVGGSIVIDAASVDTKNKKRDDHLRTADFFEVSKYPMITFSVTDARPKGSGKVELVASLTIRDSTRPVNVVAEVSPSGNSAKVSVELDIDRSDWGLTWAKMGAGLKNHVVIDAVFTKA
jgi:polyisoprenoid-binding protein YceI